MYHHCHGWSRRYAFGWANSAKDCDFETATPSYQSRRHRSARGGGYGARRPLRYLSYNLDLDENQVRKIAAVLDGLKMEREQASLDEKKTVSELAKLVTVENVGVDDLRAALAPRVQSTERLQVTIAKGLQEIVDILDVDQRQEFAYLLRSGAFRI